MKLILLTYSITALTLFVQAQPLQGKFVYGDEVLVFDSNRVYFNVGSNGGLVFNFNGAGYYTISDDFLFVDTYVDTVANPRVETECNGKSSILVQDMNAMPIPYTGITFNTPTGKATWRSTDRAGKLEYSIQDTGMTAEIFERSHGTTNIQVAAGCEYVVTMPKGSVINHTTVVFRIFSMTENKIEAALVSLDFKYPRTDKKQLKRLHKASTDEDTYVKTFVLK